MNFRLQLFRRERAAGMALAETPVGFKPFLMRAPHEPEFQRRAL
jgi:hypothetical protein